MAAKNINLLGEERVVNPEVQRARHALKTSIMLVTVFFFLIVSSIFIALLYMSNQLESTSKAITSERARIKALEKNEGAYVLLKQKSVSLVQIISNRYPYIPLIEYLKQLIEEKAAIHSMSLRETGETEITITVADSQGLDSFINELLEESDKRFARIELRTFRATNDGTYDATLLLTANRVESVAQPVQ